MLRRVALVVAALVACSSVAWGQASDKYNLGRSLLEKGEYREAAGAFLSHYRLHPKDQNAPRSLYYLGQSLMGLGQPSQACKSYKELEEVYRTSIPSDVRDALTEAKRSANCSTASVADAGPPTPYIGVGVEPVTDDSLAQALGVEPGHAEIIRSVVDGGPAEKAGIRTGDLISAVNGQPVTTKTGATSLIADNLVGAPITLTILRGGQQRQLTAASVNRARIEELADAAPKLAQSKTGALSGPAASPGEPQNVGGMTLLTLAPGIAEPLSLPNDVRGAVVSRVEADSAAEEEGLKRGDVILRVGSEDVDNADRAKALIEQAFTGARKAAVLYVQRGDNVPAFIGLHPQSRVAATAALWGPLTAELGGQWVDGEGYIWRDSWLKKGQQLNSFKRRPGEKLGWNYTSVLKSDGTIEQTSEGPNGTKTAIIRAVGPTTFRYRTTNTDGKPFEGIGTKYLEPTVHRTVYQEIRNGIAQKPFSETTTRVLKEGEEAQLAAARKARQQAAQAAQAEAKQEAAERAARKSSGGGLFGALKGAVAGISAVANGGGDLDEGLSAAAIGGVAGAAGVDANTIGSAMSSVDYSGSGASSGGIASALGRGGAGGGEAVSARPPVSMPGCDAVGVNSGNYQSAALSGGNDIQLKTMCGQAYEYYSMYKHALDQGYSEADANRTYDAHAKSAAVANDFYANNRAN